MTRDQKIEAFTMRIDGYSYREIADKMGISKQAVQDTLKRCLSRGGWDQAFCEKCVYPNIFKYMQDHKINLSEFSTSTGIVYSNLSKFLKGASNPSQASIDKILKATGMTYEEAFWREENETESDA